MDTWHGPSLRVEEYVDQGQEYDISAWVKLISPESSQLQLSTQVGDGDGASYNNLQGKTISTEDGWVKLEGTYRYSSVGGEFLSIYVESSNNSTASFYIDDITFEPTGSGDVEVEKDLTPIKEVYKDDFLIGNIISAGDFEGERLELLKMHHNLVTAENAMKPGYAYDDNGEFDFEAEDALVQNAQNEG
ncbi:endo-1,4-beta-xylanase A precursor [Gracilibacillus boraciitolerans JCM 21714]|uniref:Endo-1,4-beta-xylanase A n=1 Tax=Gracilibacillus boraciitolerans JCM 21714 TaxID=1298598 RepID=W4VL46_9BACI|nr:endo-1,4-beta-xylanase A precursor [Gracilibacillus boraciitolerans JCM 21714]